MKDKDVLLAFEAREMMPKEPEPWQELVEERPPIFPTMLLPEKWGRLIEDYAKAVVVPVDYAACALLGTVSAAIVGRIDILPQKGQRESVQLYQCLCGEPGTRKTAAMNEFLKPLNRYFFEKNKEIWKLNRENAHKRELLLTEAKGRGKSLDDRVRLRMKAEEIEDVAEYEKIMGNATLEAIEDRMRKQNGRGNIFADEGSLVDIMTGSMYNRQGGKANLDTLLDAWNGGMVNVDRIGRECFSIPRADLSITLGLQPIQLRSMTENEVAAGRGLPQRFLYYLPEMLIGENVMNLPPFPEKQLVEWGEYITTLADVHRDQLCELKFTKSAGNLYVAHWQDMVNRATGDMGDNAALKGWGRKAHGETARLAGILALLENPDTTIVEEAHDRAAVELMNSYYIPHAKRAFGGGPDLSAPAKALLDKLRTVEVFSESEMLRSLAGQTRYKGKNGKDFFSQVLAELSANGYVRRKLAQHTGRGRPSSPVWEVHPDICGHRESLKPVQEGCF